MHSTARKLMEALTAYAPKKGQSDWHRLRRILQANADSYFGRKCGFSKIDSIEAFRKEVPIHEYTEIESLVERTRRGESSVLTCEAIVAFERTSGSSGAPKWIPYTESLRGNFAEALCFWITGLCKYQPSALSGKAYWALSPQFKEIKATASSSDIESDGDYFPPDVGAALMDWLVKPEVVVGDDCTDDFYERTLDTLLAEPELSFISVWSPTFFLALDERLRKRGFTFETWKDLWPKLALVSCWADAGSARWVSAVRESSGVAVEPKGLLSTEGVVSIPDGSMKAPLLFRGGHLIEFEQAETGRVCCRDELCEGALYSIVLTTSSGLYRYRTGDQIQVVSIESTDTIRVQFIGREGVLSDLVGEKIDERFVAYVFRQCRISGFLAADSEQNQYTLWLPDAETERASEVIMQLRQNPYFSQALELGQLRPILIKPLSVGWEGCYSEAIARSNGCRVGDVKLPVLLVNPLDELGDVCLNS